MFSEAGVVLKTLTEVESLDDVQQIVDEVCKCVVEITPFKLALLTVYFESGVYVGLEGGSDELRQRFLETARTEMRERLSMEAVARGEGPGSFQRPARAALVRDAHEPAKPQPGDPLD